MTDDRRYLLGTLVEIDQLIAGARDAVAKLLIDDIYQERAHDQLGLLRKAESIALD